MMTVGKSFAGGRGIPFVLLMKVCDELQRFTNPSLKQRLNPEGGSPLGEGT